MDAHDYANYDATGLAELIRDKQVTAEEVHDAARAAIEAVNPTINAIADGPWERVLDHAADGVFAGVPYALKDDPGCHAADVRYRYGSRLTGDGIVFPYDSFLVQRFRESGLAAMALATTPEFSSSANTVTIVNGATRNPWDPGRSVGGSSGGSSAIVASGALPIAHGSDAGGSIRFPASWNGVVGLKPSRGRVSPGPDKQDGMAFGLSHEFAITRTVRDSAAILDAVAGAMPGDGVVLPPPQRPWLDEVGAPPGRLRIAVCTEAFSGSTDPEVVAVVDQTAKLLEQLGHHVEVAAPVVNWDEFMSGMIPMGGVGIYALVKAIGSFTGLEPGPDTLEAASLAAYRYGTSVSVDDFLAFLGPVNNVARSIGQFFVEWDVFVTPTAQVPALPIEFLRNDDTSIDIGRWLRMMFEVFSSFTPLFNVTGTPAISLPLGETATGLPVGVQLATPMCDEATLFRVAAQLEDAMPWVGRRPRVHAANE